MQIIIQDPPSVDHINHTADRLPEMICWTVLYDGDDVVAFSGLQDFEDGTARVNSRCYIMPEYRHGERYPWTWLAPEQIEIADALGFTKLFWTTHLYRYPEKTMRHTIKHATPHLPSGWRFNYAGMQTIRGVEQAVCEILKS